MKAARRIAVALAVVLVAVAFPLVVSQPVLADQGEGATATVNDQERRIAVGGLHACTVLDSGAVQCWGNNGQGQLGNGTRTAATSPVTVTGVDAVVGLAAGAEHTCALIYGGTVRCWGLDASGQLGDGDVVGTTKLAAVPVLAPSGPGLLGGATAIAAGSFHTCAIVTDGTVWCWGHDGSGQLGDDGTGTQFRPVAAIGITSANPATAISAGEFHTCATLADGTVKCWGHNGFGQLGDTSTTDRRVPTTVPGITSANKAKAIVAGSSHTCVLLEDTTARCWGLNTFGQLGNNTTTNSSTPVTVSGLNAVAIAAGVSHSCALLAGGVVKCWGANGRKQLGYQPLTDNLRLVPQPVAGLPAAAAVTAGGYETCALTGASMRCWGYNFYGQLGSFAPSSNVPVTVTALSGATSVAAGTSHGCALTGVGAPPAPPQAPRCWGTNANGELGADLTAAQAPTATIHVAVSGITDADALTAGNGHVCALLDAAGSTPRCWGRNASGQLGDTTTTERRAPVPVSGLTTATQVDAGGTADPAAGGAEIGHTCARLSDGTARCWGDNTYGQLGDGTNTSSAAPVPVRYDNDNDSSTPAIVLIGVVAVTAGGRHSCAVLTDLQVRCWGRNVNGQLGDNTTTDRNLATRVKEIDDPDPDQVVYLHDVAAIDAGGRHTCVARTAAFSGAVRCWGANNHGQVGDGTTSERHLPTLVSNIPFTTSAGLSKASDVALGEDHSCSLLENTRMVCWGRNDSGQLGIGSNSASSTPVVPTNFDPPSEVTTFITSISAGRANTCASLIDTTVSCWGDNSQGQLGDGIGPDSVTPRLVTSFSGTVATNHIPAPVDDVATTAPLTQVTIGVLDNDDDVDGDTLTIHSVATPGKGTSAIVAGAISYTPDASACAPTSATYGTDTFTYAVTDGQAVVPASVTVTITCPNRPPVAQSDAATTGEDTSATIDVLANDSDPDGDPLTISLVSDPPGGTTAIVSNKVFYTPDAQYCGADSFSYTADDGTDTASAAVTVTVGCTNDAPVAVDDAVSTDEDVPVSVDLVANDTDADVTDTLTLVSLTDPGHGTAVKNANGTAGYAPDAGYCGSDSFDYTMTDGTTFDVGHVTVTVECLPGGPNAADDSATTTEDTSVVIDVLVNDSDPDGDPLTVASVQDPPHGAAGIAANKITYSPDPDYCGADSFGYTITDGASTDSALVVPVEIICVQDDPIVVDDSATAAEDAPVASDVLANDSDPDLDALSVVSVSDPAKGTTSIGSTGHVAYVPDPDTCLGDTFTYTVTDNHGHTATATVWVAVTCVNDAPVIAPVADQSTAWGDPLVVLMGASDADGDPVSYSLVSPPPGASISSGGALSWTPAANQVGTYTLTVRASDASSSSEQSFDAVVTKRATSIAYTGDTTEQYSDRAQVVARLVDAAWGTTAMTGRTLSFALGGASTSAVTDGSGLASTTLSISTAPGPSSMGTAFAGDAVYTASNTATPFTITKEAITVALSGPFNTTSAGPTATIALSATVAEQADGTLGSGLAGVQVAFATLGAGAPLCTAPVSSAGNGSGTATCNASLALGSHAIVITMSSSLYEGPLDVSALVVAGSAAGSASGGGRIGGSPRDDFAFQVTPATKKAPMEGSAVHIWRSADGTTAYVVRSTALTSSSVSCTGGKVKVCTTSPNFVSASTTAVTLATGVTAAQAGTSSMAVQATAPDRYAITISGATTHQVGTPSSLVTISQGLIRTS